MALRVLLADESSTIKKVMQLALSDFGIDVKSVPVGLDVLPVAKSFKPDIIFTDVLLAKRNGYEVCSDIKNDPETAKIPVVLMWSGFMEVDEAKISESHADGRLEKPFDAENLRNLVNNLVQKTKSNPVSSFLNFPAMPEFDDAGAGAPNVENTIDNIYNVPEENSLGTGTISIVDKPEVHPLDIPGEEFSAVPLTTPRGEHEHDEGGWAHQDLTKFKLNIPLENEEAAGFASKFVIPQDDELSNPQFETDGTFEEVSFHGNIDEAELGLDLAEKKKASNVAQSAAAAPAQTTPASAPKMTSAVAEDVVQKMAKTVKDQMMESLKRGPSSPSAAQPKSQSPGDMNAEMMEKIVREEAREMIEAICWKVLPEIAERIVREEINKILRESERSI
ncbi:MAG TPA: response regulator [Bdellovibrio sp.]|nr:response regulator [Bdellovibrio sp.]